MKQTTYKLDVPSLMNYSVIYINITDIIVSNNTLTRRVHWANISVVTPPEVGDTEGFEGTAITELVEVIALVEEGLLVVVILIIDDSSSVPKMMTPIHLRWQHSIL